MNWKFRLAAVCAAVVGAVGCATPTTGVVQLSEGLAKVTRQGAGPWIPTSDLKAQGIQEASEYCQRSRGRVRVIDVKETQARPFGGWPEAEVLFTCD
ncbi:MAG: hypothetical protein M3Z29_03800 [Pseudomonadota bacterium]|nr:hypothetical protein [Pseudomonadota bacterium]